MNTMRSIGRFSYVATLLGLMALGACEPAPKPYGVERRMDVPGLQRRVWAVAPAINLSGQRQVDPVLEADLVYQQLQQVGGMTVVPVDRVVQVYAGLKIDKVQSPEQAALVCDLLGVEGLVVPTVTAFDPYDPPKLGAALQLFTKPAGYARPEGVDPRELAHSAAPPVTTPPTPGSAIKQAVGMFDAANGSVRDALARYAQGRNDPNGPLSEREYLLSMDRYSGFVYHELIAELLGTPSIGL